MSVESTCCRMMADNVSSVCDQHPNRQDCPDALVSKVRGGYGLIIHDGTESVLEINYCPWCGTKLPKIEDLDVR